MSSAGDGPEFMPILGAIRTDDIGASWGQVEAEDGKTEGCG